MHLSVIKMNIFILLFCKQYFDVHN
jgi:hypothetical protein